jgi:hypothetical protein
VDVVDVNVRVCPGAPVTSVKVPSMKPDAVTWMVGLFGRSLGKST